MRNLGIACLATILLASTGAQVDGKTVRRNIHRGFVVDRGATLKLKHGDGAVSIQPWDRDSLDVSVHYAVRYELGVLSGDIEVRFEQKDGVIEIAGKEKRSKVSRFTNVHLFSKHEYTYTIRGPSYLRLHLEGEDGSVEVAAWRGNIECHLDDGDATMSRLLSNEVLIKSQDGDVDVGFAIPTQISVNIETDDGCVTMRLPQDVSTTFAIDVDDGNIGVNVPSTVVLEKNCRWISGKIGNGNGEVRIKTADGDVDIRTTQTRI
jgi:DUF4097 and DUF4098 domain-containing protein YvlB